MNVQEYVKLGISFLLVIQLSPVHQENTQTHVQ